MAIVAPPRGERGLKCHAHVPSPARSAVAPPRGERGLKSKMEKGNTENGKVAPPRGERGLKSVEPVECPGVAPSLPLVGSED